MLRLIALACCVAWITPAQAEPGSSVNYLMSDVTSSFTIGMLRIQLALDQAFAAAPGVWASVDYDWEHNRITVWYQSFSEPSEPNKDTCRGAVDKLRQVAGVRADTGKPWVENSFFAEMFMPLGYQKKNAPKNLRQDIDQIIELHANVADQNVSVSCQGPLLSTKVLYEEEAPPKAKVNAKPKN
jgi:hypothetical protein